MGLGHQNTRHQECVIQCNACFVFKQAGYCTWIQEFSLVPIQAFTDPDKCNRANPAFHLSVTQGSELENIPEDFALNM